MRIVIAGAHGQVGLRLGRLLAEGGDDVLGLVRDPGQASDLERAGVTPTVLDLETTDVDALASALAGADAVVFAAGSGPGSGPERKDSVDRAGAALLADAAQRAAVDRYVMVSSRGVEQVRDGATPDGMDEGFLTYLRAKLAAEDDLRARPLVWTVLRPGALTDDGGTGRVRLATEVPRGEVPRDDVAAVLAALLHTPAAAGKVLELSQGDDPVAEAVAALV